MGKRTALQGHNPKGAGTGINLGDGLRPEAGFGRIIAFIPRCGEYAIDQPILVEIVDTTDKIQIMLPFLDEVVGEGLITIEGVRLLRFGQAQPS